MAVNLRTLPNMRGRIPAIRSKNTGHDVAAALTTAQDALDLIATAYQSLNDEVTNLPTGGTTPAPTSVLPTH